ncbi:MAG: hypothetical protein JWM90_1182 [Thermoleophilia bacterium]|nr:hypothetical protein [Thermoleophilia bacterium]
MAKPATCTHISAIKIVEKPSRIVGCAQCRATGGEWVHLRMCHSCGEIACCDESPNQHARRHFEATHHPLMRTVERGEAWSWCFVDEVEFQVAPV